MMVYKFRTGDFNPNDAPGSETPNVADHKIKAIFESSSQSHEEVGIPQKRLFCSNKLDWS